MIAFPNSPLAYYIDKVINFIGWSNFKSKRSFIHKKQFFEVFLLFGFSAWFPLTAGTLWMYPLWLVLSYMLICQLGPKKPGKFKVKFTLSQARDFEKAFNPKTDYEYELSEQLVAYLEKYT